MDGTIFSAENFDMTILIDLKGDQCRGRIVAEEHLVITEEEILSQVSIHTL